MENKNLNCKVSILKKVFNFLRLLIYIQKILPSKRDLDYMIPKGITKTPLPNTKYIF
jgi:hypothetical protein